MMADSANAEAEPTEPIVKASSGSVSLGWPPAPAGAGAAGVAATCAANAASNGEAAPKCAVDGASLGSENKEALPEDAIARCRAIRLITY